MDDLNNLSKQWDEVLLEECEIRIRQGKILREIRAIAKQQDPTATRFYKWLRERKISKSRAYLLMSLALENGDVGGM